MPRPAPVLAPVVALLALACGGVSVEPASHLQAVCDQSNGSPITEELVQIDLAVEPLEPGIRVRFDAGLTWVQWTSASTVPDLEAALQAEVQAAQSLASLTGSAAGQARVRVVAPPGTPASQVRDLLQAAHGAGIAEVHLLVASKEPVERLPYPDPVYGDELKQRLASLGPEMRAVELAAEIEGLVGLCPGAQDVFAAIAAVDPEMKCELLAVGLGEALPSCPMSDGDRIVTAVQVATEPVSDWKPTAIRLQPSPEADAIEIAPGETFEALAPKLAARHGGRAWIP